MQMMLFMNLMGRNFAVKGFLLNMLGLGLEGEEVEDHTPTILAVADLEMIDEMPHLEEQKIDLELRIYPQESAGRISKISQDKLGKYPLRMHIDLEGVVEFASYGDLKTASEKLSGKEINGRKIKLIEVSKRHRSRSRSRSLTRSSSRSHSQSRLRRSKSHSRSRSRSRSRSKSGSGSRSSVPEKNQKRGSSSRSKSPASVARQRSRSQSRSRSVDSGN